MGRNKKKQFILTFILLFFLLGIFPFSIYLYSKYTDAINKRDKYLTLQFELLEQLDYRLNFLHKNNLNDLKFVLSSNGFQEYLSRKNNKSTVIDDWLLLSKLKGVYDQIRYIDENGLEVIRINYNNGIPTSTPVEKLQNKSDRYYFQKIKDYKEPTILVSYLDLNIENGEIEIPLKPMIRYSISVTNALGDFKGALVINFLADEIFKMLKEEVEIHNSNIYFLNSEGYFLSGIKEDKLWGFMYRDKKGITIFNDHSFPNNFDEEIINIGSKVFIQRKVMLNNYNGYLVDHMDKFWVLMTESKDSDIYYSNIISRIFSSLKYIITLFLFITLIISYVLTSLIYKVIGLSEDRDTFRKVMSEVVNALEVTSVLDDDDTGNHIRRVCEYSYILSKAYGLSEYKSREIKDLASLHDIGKVGVHDSILKKCGALNKEEWEEMKQHVVYGKEVINNTTLNSVALNIVYYHHENWDGTGYVSNLSGEDIPIEARIVSLADVYDALRNKRCYKPAMTHDQALAVILEESGRKFDPQIVSAFIFVEDKINEVSIKLK